MTSQVFANANTSSGFKKLPTTCSAESAAESSLEAANNFKSTPRAIAGAIIIRANWPAPITPTIGNSAPLIAQDYLLAI